MTRHTRFAVYWAPEAGSPLARAGASWLGWDADAAQAVAHPDLGTAHAALNLDQITEKPRKYGFHGTIKAPFRLAARSAPERLQAAFRQRTAEMGAFDMPALAMRWIGPFLALVPDTDAPALSEFAGQWVQSLEDHRAPLTPQDLQRRRGAALTARQDGYLVRWGYPYVFEEFRFHLTLSGPIADEARRPVITAAAQAHFGGLVGAPVRVREICLFAEAGTGRFEIIDRAQLGGHSA